MRNKWMIVHLDIACFLSLSHNGISLSVGPAPQYTILTCNVCTSTDSMTCWCCCLTSITSKYGKLTTLCSFGVWSLACMYSGSTPSIAALHFVGWLLVLLDFLVDISRSSWMCTSQGEQCCGICVLSDFDVRIPADRDSRRFTNCCSMRGFGKLAWFVGYFLWMYWWVRIISYVICAVARAFRCECVSQFPWTSEGEGPTSRHSHSYTFHTEGSVLMWSVVHLSLCTITFQVRISTTLSKIYLWNGWLVAIWSFSCIHFFSRLRTGVFTYQLCCVTTRSSVTLIPSYLNRLAIPTYPSRLF